MGSIQILRRHIIHVMLYYAFVFRFPALPTFLWSLYFAVFSSHPAFMVVALFCSAAFKKNERNASFHPVISFVIAHQDSSGRKNLPDKIDYCFIKFWKTPENVPFYFYRCFLAIPLSRLLCKILIFQWVILRVRLARVNLIYCPFCT